jgi:hypothetical protein
MSVIVATREAEFRRIMFGSQPRKIVLEPLSQKTLHKNRADGGWGRWPKQCIHM